MAELPTLNTSEVLAGVGGLLIGAGVVAGASAIARRKKTRKRRKSKNRTTRKRNSRNKKRRKTPHTAGKGKDRSTKRIRYTKKGQPYVILRNGRARFIKMSSAKRSHKTKGGRY